MASSLDDMEAYELLQIELDRSLQHFIPHIPPADQSNILHLLHSWIEYVCFIRHLSAWQELIHEDTQKAFEGWYVQSLSGKLEKEGITMLKKFQSYFSEKK